MSRLVVLLLLLASCLTLHAQVPRTITFTGVLTDANGVVRPNGTHQVTFRLFDQASNGTVLWTETTTVTTVRGLFDHALGSFAPFPTSLTFDRAYWLEIEESGVLVQPRIALRMQPYAYRAIIADSAAAAPQRPLPDGSVTAAKIAPGSVVTSIDGVRDAINLLAVNNGMLTITVSGQTITFAVRDSTGKAGWSMVSDSSRAASIADTVRNAPSVPVGTIMAFAGDGTQLSAITSKGWELCDGRSIASLGLTSEQRLALVDVLSSGGWANPLSLPDLRGYFLRGASPTGLDDGQGLTRDPGAPRAVGSYQPDAFQGHWHSVHGTAAGSSGSWGSFETTANASAAYVRSTAVRAETPTQPTTAPDSAWGAPRTSSESRPKNIAVNYIIKVR